MNEFKGFALQGSTLALTVKDTEETDRLRKTSNVLELHRKCTVTRPVIWKYIASLCRFSGAEIVTESFQSEMGVTSV